MRCLVAAGIGWSAITAASADGDFLRDVEDLPLAPGLAEDSSGSLAFDTAGGRIVEAYAHGDVSENQVLRFYQETLPQLGWAAESARQYHRDGERLRLSVTRGTGGIIVHYSLSPL